jgi:hypothetical protein
MSNKDMRFVGELLRVGLQNVADAEVRCRFKTQEEPEPEAADSAAVAAGEVPDDAEAAHGSSRFVRVAEACAESRIVAVAGACGKRILNPFGFEIS